MRWLVPAMPRCRTHRPAVTEAQLPCHSQPAATVAGTHSGTWILYAYLTYNPEQKLDVGLQSCRLCFFSASAARAQAVDDFVVSCPERKERRTLDRSTSCVGLWCTLTVRLANCQQRCTTCHRWCTFRHDVLAKLAASSEKSDLMGAGTFQLLSSHTESVQELLASFNVAAGCRARHTIAQSHLAPTRACTSTST